MDVYVKSSEHFQPGSIKELIKQKVEKRKEPKCLKTWRVWSKKAGKESNHVCIVQRDANGQIKSTRTCNSCPNTHQKTCRPNTTRDQHPTLPFTLILHKECFWTSQFHPPQMLLENMIYYLLFCLKILLMQPQPLPWGLSLQDSH